MRKDSRKIAVAAAALRPFYAAAQPETKNIGFADKPFTYQHKLHPGNYILITDTPP